MGDHVIVNVEAQLARRISDEAEALEARAEALRQRIRMDAPKADAVADAFERAKAQSAVRSLVAEVERLERQAAETRAAARKAVQRALSLPDDTDPARLDPVQRVPVSQKEAEAAAVDLEAGRWAKLRSRRDALLAASDWTQQPDAPVDDQAWAAYRQRLRDLPANTKNPLKAEWPTPPA